MMISGKKYLETKALEVNKALKGIFPQKHAAGQVLYDAMNYSLLAGGKRLRPVLFLATLEALDTPTKKLMPFACAIEMIHTYSLIHDDLPAMDNDDYRRGKPTAHKVYGEANAILAGDALLTHAFAIMLSCYADPHHLLYATRQVAVAAGINGMVVGQVMDIEKEGKKVSLEELKNIHLNKTGALFNAAVLSAGILGAADEKEMEALTVFAYNFGVSFQIIDDILDVVGDEAKLGKPVGSDTKNAKTTYPALLGLAKASEAADDAVSKAIAALQPFGERAENLKAIVKHLSSRES
ncbi:MAG: polyprenyl synthetase family protein [Clostridia bacterium]|nr:polyprenyl synthetase family protein [Clostridia bacterium]MDD4572258.1 polyprenyl synthetase family protein [Clostridia bacterium]